jgi:hypothetical protein
MTLLTKKIITGIFFITAIVLLTSCFSSKKNALIKKLETAKSLAKDDAAKIGAMLQKKDEKANEEKIDSLINVNITNNINTHKAQLDTFSNSMSFIDSVISTGKLFRKNKAEIKAKLKLIENYMANSNVRLRRFQMIDEGLDIAEQKLFKLAAFFGGGKYEIPAEKVNDAKNSFSAILDSVANFYNKYNDLDKKATIVILGYADGTGFNKEGPTYKALVALINNGEPSKEKINQKLSELRANNIANLLEIMLAERIPNYSTIEKIDFEYLQQGKGEEYPSKKITNYTIDDEHRKVVLLFWNILPR